MSKISVFRSLVVIASFTTMALLYVHQEVEIYKTSFQINHNRQQVNRLLDRHRSLIYNLTQLESPKRVEDILTTNEITLCMPKTENIYRFDEKKPIYTAHNANGTKKTSLFADLIDRFSSKAEAKVIK